MNNPYFHLAAEDFFLKELDCTEQDYLFIYINSPAVVIGRNQNIFEEIDIAYCKSNQISICRRISGGGTVYHDFGNINIAFFSKRSFDKVNNYNFFMKPLFDFLQTKGIKAYLNERNSIYLGDKKIGGNAQFTNKNNILSHCTLLLSANLEQLEKSISSPFKHIESIASKSVRSQIMNLADLISIDNIIEFINEIEVYYCNNFPIKVITISNEQFDKIEKHHVPIFNSFEWIYARSPKCEIYVKDEHFIIQNGLIANSINPDFKNLAFLPQEQLIPYFNKM